MIANDMTSMNEEASEGVCRGRQIERDGYLVNDHERPVAIYEGLGPRVAHGEDHTLSFAHGYPFLVKQTSKPHGH